MHVTVMHGAGNSFVIPTLASGTLQGGDLRILALRLCAAKKTDGMIVLTPAADEGADLDMLFYNSDGSLGEMCGNGARCAARWGFEHGLVEDETAIRIRATAGLVKARRISGELYQVRLNDPSVVDLGRLGGGVVLRIIGDGLHAELLARLHEASLDGGEVLVGERVGLKPYGVLLLLRREGAHGKREHEGNGQDNS